MKKAIILLIFIILNINFSHSQTWEMFNKDNSAITINTINNLIIDANDNIWIAGYSSIFMFNTSNQNWIEYNKSNSQIGEKINYLFRDYNDNIWAAGDGIYKFDRKKQSWQPIDTTINAEYIAVDKNENIYIVRSLKVLVYKDNSWTVIFNGQDDGPRYPSKLVIDKNNWVWFGTSGFPDGVYSYNGNELKVYNNSNYEIPNFVTENLALDSLNNLWFLTANNLLTYKYNTDSDNWIKYDSLNSILGTQNVSFSKNIQIKDKLWITSTKLPGLKPRRLINFNFAKWTEYDIDKVLDLDTVQYLYLNALAIDSKNNVWIGTNKGLIKFNETQNSVSTFEKYNIRLFPNPTSDLLNIDLSDKQVLSYTITNIEGRIVKQMHKYFSKHIAIDTKSLNSGTYFIKLNLSDNQTIQSKFVKE